MNFIGKICINENRQGYINIIMNISTFELVISSTHSISELNYLMNKIIISSKEFRKTFNSEDIKTVFSYFNFSIYSLNKVNFSINDEIIFKYVKGEM